MHKWFIFLAVLLLASGCSTKYYQDRAVRRARAYLLDSEELRLDRAQKEYVKFNKPIILMSTILQAYPYGYHQFCITWQIPGVKEAAMVFGASDQRMIDWSPNRLIMRDFSPWDQNRKRTVDAARRYALNNMFHSFTTEQYNHIRFTEPEIVATTFDLFTERPGEFDPEDMAREMASKQQFSVIWTLPGGGSECAILCGLSSETLAGWSLNFGTVMDQAEVERHSTGEAPAVSLDAVEFVELSGSRLERLPQPAESE